MTENEKLIKDGNEAIEVIKSNMPTSGYYMLRESLDMAVKALKEVQEYRKIGTLEELKAAKIYIDLAKKHDTIGKVIESCADYEAIGTAEEVREAVEKTKAKKIIKRSFVIPYEGIDACPVCKEALGRITNFCRNCGQRLESE